MLALLRAEFSRMFKSRGLYISLLIGALLSIWLVILATKMHNESMQLLAEEGLESAAYFFPSSVFTICIGMDYSQLPTAILFSIFPVLVTIPFSATYCQDNSNGYLKVILTRADRKKYHIAKYITVFTSGLIVVLAILAFSLFLTTLFIPAIYPQSASYTFPVTGSTHLWNDIYRENPYLYILIYSLVDAVFLAVWSTIPLSLSLIVKNRFAVLAGSAVLYYIFNYLLGLANLDYCMPSNFLRQYQPTRIDIGIIGFEVISILVITISTFVIIGARKDVR